MPAPEGEAKDPLIGRVIADKIQIESRIGGGAMGDVYRARHRALDKQIAIKVLKRTRDTETAAKRFEIEARAASKLDHPNTVRVLDFGNDGSDGLLYLAMEYLEGLTMRQVLDREGPLAAERIARIMVQVCSALAEAHDKGILHRDLKPANVMLTARHGNRGRIEDFVKVCDFGLAKLFDITGTEAMESELTGQGLLLGTPGYMSPEQVMGKPLDGRADIYACGVIMYRSITGRLPYSAKNLQELTFQQLNADAPSLLEKAPATDAGFAGIVKKALAREREDRFSSVRALREALAGFLERAGVDVPSSDAQSIPSGIRVRPDQPTLNLSAEAVSFDPGTVSVEAGKPSAPASGRGKVIAMAAVLGSVLGIGGMLQLQRRPEPTEVGAGPGAPVAPPPSVAPEPVLRLEIGDAPAGTEVWSEQGMVGTAPGTIELRLHGPVHLSFRAEGYVSQTHVFTEPGVLHMDVALDRRPVPADQPPKGRPPPPPPPVRHGGRDALESPFKKGRSP